MGDSNLEKMLKRAVVSAMQKNNKIMPFFKLQSLVRMSEEISNRARVGLNRRLRTC